MSVTAPTILVHFSEARSDLAEYLADVGYEVRDYAWGGRTGTPALIITDQSLELPETAGNESALGLDAIGMITLGTGCIWAAGKMRYPDARLSADVTGRELVTVAGLVREIAELRRRHDEERQECQRWIELAMQDPLTGLPNRRAWDLHLAEQLAGRQPLCVALVDVDRFKQINDQGGQGVGDQVLREVGRVMRGRLRRRDLVARVGGDEFGIVLQDLDRGLAAHVLERLRQIVTEKLAALHLPRTTLSVGFVIVPADDRGCASEVFSAAAISLQAAKQLSRTQALGWLPDASGSSSPPSSKPQSSKRTET